MGVFVGRCPRALLRTVRSIEAARRRQAGPAVREILTVFAGSLAAGGVVWTCATTDPTLPIRRTTTVSSIQMATKSLRMKAVRTLMNSVRGRKYNVA